MRTLSCERLVFEVKETNHRARRALPILAAVIVIVSPGVQAADDDLYLPRPTFSEAFQLWHNGQVADALTLLDRQLAPGSDDQPLAALVLRASLLEEAGRPVDAERLWTDVISREAWMRTFARRALVRSLAARGEPGRADQVLAELARSDASRHLDLAVDVAASYRVAGDTRRAARLYQQVLAQQRRGVWADAARLGLASTLELGGDPEAALSVFHEAKLLYRQGDTFLCATRRATPGRSAGAQAKSPRRGPIPDTRAPSEERVKVQPGVVVDRGMACRSSLNRSPRPRGSGTDRHARRATS